MSDTDEDAIPDTPSPVFGKRKLNLVKTRGRVEELKSTLSKKLCFDNTFPGLRPDQVTKTGIRNITNRHTRPPGTESEKEKLTSAAEAKPRRPTVKPRTSTKCQRLIPQLLSTDSEGSDDDEDDFVIAPKSKAIKVRSCVQDVNDDAAAAMGCEHHSSNDSDASDSVLAQPTMQLIIRKKKSPREKAEKNVLDNHVEAGLSVDRSDDKTEDLCNNVDQSDNKTEDFSNDELIPKIRRKKNKLRLISSSDDSDEESLRNIKFSLSTQYVPSKQKLAKNKSKGGMQLLAHEPIIDLSKETDEQSSSDIDDDELEHFVNKCRNPSEDVKVEQRDKDKLFVCKREQLPKSSTNPLPPDPCDISTKPAVDLAITENGLNQCKKHHRGHKGHSTSASRRNDFRPAGSHLPSGHLHAGHASAEIGAAAPPGPGSSRSSSSSREVRTRKPPGSTSKVKIRNSSDGSARARSAAEARGTVRSQRRNLPRSPAESAGNNSMTEVLGMVNQLEEDEQLARQLQVEMDQQFATMLAASATPTHQRQRNSPSYSAGRESHVNLQVEEVVQKLSQLTQWQWEVHLALFRGQDIPPFPDGFSHQQLDEVVDADVLEYLYHHPEVAVEQHNEAVEAIRVQANRASSGSHRRHSDATRGRSRWRPAAAAPNETPPVVIVASRQAPATRVTRQTRRGQGRPGTNTFDFLSRLTRVNLPGQFHPLDQELQELLQSFEVQRPRGRTGRRPGMTNIFERDDGNDYEELLTLAEQIGTVVRKAGLSVSQIGRLPQRTFDPADLKPGDPVPECLVCMSEYQDGDVQRILTCFHTFHCACIDKWIKENPTCPVCRTEVVV